MAVWNHNRTRQRRRPSRRLSGNNRYRTSVDVSRRRERWRNILNPEQGHRNSGMTAQQNSEPRTGTTTETATHQSLPNNETQAVPLCEVQEGQIRDARPQVQLAPRTPPAQQSRDGGTGVAPQFASFPNYSPPAQTRGEIGAYWQPPGELQVTLPLEAPFSAPFFEFQPFVQPFTPALGTSLEPYAHGYPNQISNQPPIFNQSGAAPSIITANVIKEESTTTTLFGTTTTVTHTVSYTKTN